VTSGFGRALAANLVLYPVLILLTLFGICAFPLFHLFCKLILRWPKHKIALLLIWLYGRAWMLCVQAFFPVRLLNASAEKLRSPCILIFNHLSAFDLFCMGLLPVFEVSMAVRAWPFKMFWFAPFMRMARYLEVERDAPERLVRLGREIFADKGRILFFPEGSRSRDGKLQRFRSGAFKLALECGADVVPICIFGSGGLLPPGSFWLRPRPVTLIALDRVDHREFLDPKHGELGHIALRKLVKARMAAQLGAGPETAQANDGGAGD
jgi:1-acyl-sn-glycerol-3-phosphate acyltransferase